MGRDTDAITVVGVKIPVEQFGVNCADCDLCDGEFLSCEGCLKNLREDIRKEIDTSSGRCFLGPYEIYQEIYDNDSKTSIFVFTKEKNLSPKPKLSILTLSNNFFRNETNFSNTFPTSISRTSLSAYLLFST